MRPGTSGSTWVISWPFAEAPGKGSGHPFPGVGSFLQELLAYGFSIIRGPSLEAQWVKNLPAVQETQVHFLSWKDPLEKEMANHSSILA